MTEYALAPNRKWTAEAGYNTPRVMLEQGLLNAYRVRSNGTMRHLELYPLGGTVREAAEYVSDRIDMDGASVQAVARELHVSTPTIRRYLESLELTEEIEDGEWDELSFDSAGNPVWAVAETGTVDDIVDLLDNAPTVADLIDANSKSTDVAPRPVRTRQARKCTVCGKNVTARNSAAKVYGSIGHEDMCVTCYDQAGLENEHSDGHHADEPNADCPQCKDKILLAQNRARFASKTDAAAEVPGGQCEPTGTTADELETTLAASVAATKSSGWTAMTPGRASQGAPACFCGDNGVHVPGAAGCKNLPIPRRTRSH